MSTESRLNELYDCIEFESTVIQSCVQLLRSKDSEFEMDDLVKTVRVALTKLDTFCYSLSCELSSDEVP